MPQMKGKYERRDGRGWKDGGDGFFLNVEGLNSCEIQLGFLFLWWIIVFELYPCISYFSVAVLKSRARPTYKRKSLSGLTVREEFIREGKNDSQQQAWARARTSGWAQTWPQIRSREWVGSAVRLLTLKSTPKWCTFSSKAVPPHNLSEQHRQLGINQVFKCLSLSKTFLIQNSTIQ